MKIRVKYYESLGGPIAAYLELILDPVAVFEWVDGTPYKATII